MIRVKSGKMKYIFVVLSVVVAICHAKSPGEQLPLGGPAGVCPSEDGEKPVYLLDLHNIYAFYECANGKPHIQYCTAGLVFNPKKETCDFPSAGWEPFGPVGTCSEMNSAFPVFLRDGMSRKVFYMCVGCAAKKLECAEDLTYNPYTQSCYLL